MARCCLRRPRRVSTLLHGAAQWLGARPTAKHGWSALLHDVSHCVAARETAVAQEQHPEEQVDAGRDERRRGDEVGPVASVQPLWRHLWPPTHRLRQRLRAKQRALHQALLVLP